MLHWLLCNLLVFNLLLNYHSTALFAKCVSWISCGWTSSHAQWFSDNHSPFCTNFPQRVSWYCTDPSVPVDGQSMFHGREMLSFSSSLLMTDVNLASCSELKWFFQSPLTPDNKVRPISTSQPALHRCNLWQIFLNYSQSILFKLVTSVHFFSQIRWQKPKSAWLLKANECV